MARPRAGRRRASSSRRSLIRSKRLCPHALAHEYDHPRYHPSVSLDDIRSLLDAPSPAAFVTYRGDGSADASPVWFHCTDSAFEVVVAADDPKLRHTAFDDRAVLTKFETVPPFRGVKVVGRPRAVLVARAISQEQQESAVFVAQRHRRL